jgi:hypothetical protein
VKSSTIKPELKDFPNETVMPKRARMPHMFFVKFSDAKLRADNPKADIGEIAKLRT